LEGDYNVKIMAVTKGACGIINPHHSQSHATEAEKGGGKREVQGGKTEWGKPNNKIAGAEIAQPGGKVNAAHFPRSERPRKKEWGVEMQTAREGTGPGRSGTIKELIKLGQKIYSLGQGHETGTKDAEKKDTSEGKMAQISQEKKTKLERLDLKPTKGPTDPSRPGKRSKKQKKKRRGRSPNRPAPR